MNNQMKMFVPAVVFAALASASARANNGDTAQPLEKSPLSAGGKGMKRQVITLTPQQDESTLKVELLIGQTLNVDCNQHRLGGTLETKRWKAGATTIMSLITSPLRYQP